MEKINFVNGTAPALNATNLNQMQDNIENAVNGIIESGSNSNGEYIKFADGTMICTKKVTGKASITSKWGELYDTGDTPLDLGDWAIPFLSFPRISIQFIGANGQWVESFPVTPSKTSAGKITIASATSKTVNCYYDIIAIGKWK